jgi:hypothetical protein
VSIDYKTLLSDYNVVSGEYGIILSLFTKNENNELTGLKDYYFSSKDMMGNPYSFSIYTNQAAHFNIKDINGTRIVGA